MHKTAAELIAEGHDVQSDEDWERDRLAQLAEAAAAKAEREQEWQEHVAETERQKERHAGMTAEEILDELMGLEVAEAAESRAEDQSPEPGLAEEREKSEPDWVDVAIAEAPEPPGSLPYDAYRARKHIQETMSLMKILARRNTYMSWQAGAASGVGLGTTAISSIGNKPLEEEQEQEQELWKKWPAFPTYFPAAPTHDRTMRVKLPEAGKLTRWKDLPAASKQDPQQQEILFGLRVTSLAAGTGTPTLSDWMTATPSADVGMFSLKLQRDAASRFLRAEEGAGAAGLRRGLLRSLQTLSGDCSAAALWTVSDHAPDDLTLFVAIRMIDQVAVRYAQTFDEGTRRVQRWQASGVRVNLGRPHPAEMWKSYEQTAEEVAANTEDWPEYAPGSEGEEDRKQDQNPYEFYPGIGFAAPAKIIKRRLHVEALWNKTVQAYGLPNWFSDRFVHQLQDYLTRHPDDQKQRAVVVAAMKKRLATDKQKSALARLDMIETQMGDLRFYKGSPAQFAAMALASGRVVGAYCDADHKAGAVKTLYEELRAGGLAS